MSPSPTLSKLVTAEELLQEPLNQFHYELVKGELREMPAAGAGHGSTGMKLVAPLGVYVEDNELGQVFMAETGFVIARNPYTVLAPDCAFVRRARVPPSWGKGFFEGPPDLAIEVISPDELPAAANRKAEEWLAGGTLEVWVLHLRNRTVVVYSSGNDKKVLRMGDEIDGGTVVPGFRFPVARIFGPRA